jgi:hypothetical protein
MSVVVRSGIPNNGPRSWDDADGLGQSPQFCLLGCNCSAERGINGTMRVEDPCVAKVRPHGSDKSGG